MKTNEKANWQQFKDYKSLVSYWESYNPFWDIFPVDFDELNFNSTNDGENYKVTINYKGEIQNFEFVYGKLKVFFNKKYPDGSIKIFRNVYIPSSYIPVDDENFCLAINLELEGCEVFKTVEASLLKQDFYLLSDFQHYLSKLA